MKSIVIDIGGTNFRVGIFTDKNEIVDTDRSETPNFINHPSLSIDQLQELLIGTLISKVKSYRQKYESITSVGLSFPAAITNTGVTHKVPTVWGKEGAGYPLVDNLKRKLPEINWVVANDITAAAERYGQMEKYRSVDYLCVITVGSGIGNKIYDVQNKKVILDKKGIGGEIGHVQYNVSNDAPVCDCGGRGHIACYSSGRAVEKLAQAFSGKSLHEFTGSILRKICKTPEQITNHEFVEAAKQKDKFTLDILDQTTFPLAYAIGYLSGAIGVEKFVVIGGFALILGDTYLESLRRSLRKIEFFSRNSSEIENLVELGISDDNDCLIGIGLLTKKQIAAPLGRG